jgi:VanZ family protein
MLGPVLERTPREREWVSWLWVGLCALGIFATVPLARSIQLFVQDRWGRELFLVVVMAAALLAALAGAIALARRPTGDRRGRATSTLWLLAVSAVFVGYTWKLREAPEEALHFVEYGVFGVLSFRALSHRLRDTGIYLVAALLGALVGATDELIQWITPDRYWGLRDVWLNFFATALVQVGIALGLRPAYVRGLPGRRSARLLCRVAFATALLLGLSLLNTGERIDWYAARVPGLAFLASNPTSMAEYGHLYEIPGAVRFRSRLAPEELARADRERAEEAAAILDRFRSEEDYPRFLAIYTPAKDPFLHEARVHLFRRDRYRREADETRDAGLRRYRLGVAWGENAILERHFGETLHRSSYALPAEEIARLEAARPEDVYESPVSGHLFARVSERGVAVATLAVLVALLAADRALGRARET